MAWKQERAAAIIKKLSPPDDGRQDPANFGIPALTINRGKRSGRQRGRAVPCHDAECMVDFLPPTTTDIAVDANTVDRLIEIITQAAKMGRIGANKVIIKGRGQHARCAMSEKFTLQAALLSHYASFMPYLMPTLSVSTVDDWPGCTQK